MLFRPSSWFYVKDFGTYIPDERVCFIKDTNTLTIYFLNSDGTESIGTNESDRFMGVLLWNI
nr:MAG TPA: hypothetical protein [Caudoviricetes sp.]